jgi:hypothetical protein
MLRVTPDTLTELDDGLVEPADVGDAPLVTLDGAVVAELAVVAEVVDEPLEPQAAMISPQASRPAVRPNRRCRRSVRVELRFTECLSLRCLAR